jgi:hypothetical protein
VIAMLMKNRVLQPAPQGLSDAELWEIKRQYDAVYHPNTGEVRLIVGR